MTDPQAPSPVPSASPGRAAPPAAPQPSRRKFVIGFAIAAVAFILTAIGVNALFRAIDPADKFDDPVSGQPVSYTSEEHGYSIEFPAEPKETTQAVPVNGENIDLDSVVWEDADSAILSNAAVFPAGLITDVDGALEGAVEGAVANIPGGTVTESEPIELDGLPAMRAEATSSNGDVFLIVAFEGDRQFQLLTLGVDEATAQAFFDSFELTD